MNLKSLLPPGSQAKILAHLQQWFQPGSSHNSNTGVTYDSADPWLVEAQLALAAKSGVDVFMVDWYGPQDAHGDAAFKNLLAIAEFSKSPVKSGICIDKGAIKGATDPTGAFQSAYNYVLSTYAQHAAFFPDYVLEFGCGAAGVNFSGLTGINLPLLHDDPKYGPYFTWVSLPTGATAVAQHYSDPNCKIGSVCPRFFDGAPTNFNNSIWGGAVRQLDRDITGVNWQQCWVNIPQGMNYVQLVTWNDYEEGTAVEGLLSMFQG